MTRGPVVVLTFDPEIVTGAAASDSGTSIENPHSRAWASAWYTAEIRRAVMTNNDVLRTLRYALELDNGKLIELFAQGGVKLSLRQLASMLKNEDEPGFAPLTDEGLGALLDGFVMALRGPRPQGVGSPQAAEALTNNRILRALRIGLALKDTDVAAIMGLAGVSVSKAELGALFRREDHRNYQPCGNQFLRSFLRGLGIWHRSGRPLV